MPFSLPTSNGAYVVTTNVWDVSQLYSIDVKSPEFKELLVRLYQNINNIANVLNIKDSGLYPTSEFVTSQSYFPDPAFTSSSTTTPVFRPVFRLVINFPAGLGPGVTAINHNITITANYSFVKIYATASDNIGFNYYPIPWASAAGATNIEIRVTATQVIITNNSGIVFTNCYAVLEYITT